MIREMSMKMQSGQPVGRPFESRIFSRIMGVHSTK